ncbi:DnaJ domain-containing protein [Ancylobacter sp. WKF20]|uniref:DnaJ domain-containing protein n=1 Tax=Ancylobacter sp. WKF20 TaxID=3039801 RepID=UPI0024342B4E|nr:DnaJ domain-containing protein [Ancylobacter sp. WKF20]WGD30943.1 DnaJ domain-containing protein [Ancylobacter sp. WKF20]
MINLLVGAAIVALLYYGLKAFGRADAKALVRMGRGVGGTVTLLLAGFLGMRGHIETAIPLGIFGLSLIGWNLRGGMPWDRPKTTKGRTSSVRTAALDMQLDHDSGRLSGTVTIGPYAGRPLDAMDVAMVARLALELDPESRQLLEAYLDRRAPGWREHAQRDAGGRGADAPRRGTMTEEEAYQILGLPAGAGADDIRKAHRSLMKKLHPDQGGSNYLAARVNEAKDILLQRH